MEHCYLPKDLKPVTWVQQDILHVSALPNELTLQRSPSELRTVSAQLCSVAWVGLLAVYYSGGHPQEWACSYPLQMQPFLPQSSDMIRSAKHLDW